jgi:hypothetical protein
VIEQTELRKQVRKVLSAIPADRTMSEGYVAAAVARFFPEPVPAADIVFALQWNEARGWVDRRWNGDEERDEWMLTHRGRIKEGLA